MRLFSSKVKPRVQLGLDKIYLGQLQLLSIVVALYFLVISIFHFQFLDPHVLGPVAATSILAGLISLVIYFLVRFRKLPARYSHLAFIPVAAMATLSVHLHICLSRDELQMTNAFIILVVFGFVTLSPVIYTCAMIVAGGAFLYALYEIPSPNAVHFIFMIFMTMALSALGFVLRYRTLLKSVLLVNANRSKAYSLAAAAREIKDKMTEVQKANVAKDQFIANVTHELRTPLTGAMGMLDLLNDTKLNDQQTFMVATAQKSSRYLLNVVNDMLALGMIDSGKLELAQEKVDLVALTKDVVEEYRAEAEAKEISLTTGKRAQQEVAVKGDGVRLADVLSKLVSNAVKFTEEGGVIVSFTWSPDETEGKGQAIWRVADTGPGIPPESIDAMFNRFEQLDQTITRMRSGTGLGLSIVKEMVSLMGGSIEVKSDLDKGAVFKVIVELPLWSGEDVIPEPDEDEANIEAADGSNLRVLVAEDNHINQLVIITMLEKLGADVTVVDNGQLAVDAVDKAKVPFDLIFMDIQMPILDGLSASRIIKMRSRNLQPIIAVTANTGDHDMKDYEDAGIEAVVGKPIEFSHFRAVILSVLDEQKKKALR